MAHKVKKLLRIDEAAELLRCSEKTVRRLINRRELEALRIGSGLRVTSSSVQLLIDREILKFNLEHGDFDEN